MDDVRAFAHYLLADSEMDEMRSYLARGRLLEKATIEALQAQYSAELREWAKTPPPWEPLTALHDAQSEASIRGIELGCEQDAACLDIIAHRIKAAMAADDGERADPGYFERKLEEYGYAKQRQN